MDKTIYDLELHEEIVIEPGESRIAVRRVPGGWLYIVFSWVQSVSEGSGWEPSTSTFVPFHNEFQP